MTGKMSWIRSRPYADLASGEHHDQQLKVFFLGNEQGPERRSSAAVCPACADEKNVSSTHGIQLSDMTLLFEDSLGLSN